jgi:hypothetical protein
MPVALERIQPATATPARKMKIAMSSAIKAPAPNVSSSRMTSFFSAVAEKIRTKVITAKKEIREDNENMMMVSPDL